MEKGRVFARAISEYIQNNGISPEVYRFGCRTEEKLKERFAAVDETAAYNQMKVVHAMQKKPDQRGTFQSQQRIRV